MSSPPPAARAALRPTTRYRWLALVSCLFSGLLYVNALDNPYIYDDFRTVLNNASIEDVWAVRTVVYREITRPVVNFSYALDKAFWDTPLVEDGADLPLLIGFHLTNVLLHVLNVLLLFHLARRFVEDQQHRRQDPISASVQGTIVAFVSAAMFGMHPLMTESVGYISGRAEVLCASFFLLALIAGRRWMRGDGTRWLGVAFPLWIAALLSKEIAATWPLVLLAYDRFVLRDDPAASRRRWRRVLAPLMGVTLLLGLIRVAVLVFVENPGEATITWRYALVEIEVFFRYFGLLLSPADQTIFHQVSEVRWPPEPPMVLACVWLLTWIGVALKLRQLDGAVTMGMLWFLLLLVPSALLVLLNLGEPMAEHRVYLAAGGFFLALGTLVGHVWAFLGTRTRRNRLLLRFSIAVWLTAMGGLTVLRNDVWGDPVAVWLEASERSPDIFVPHVMLGGILQERGAREEALVAFRRAIRLRPDEKIAHMKLGLCLAELGRLDEARHAFETVLRLDAGAAVGHNGLGAVAMLAGRHAEAREHYENALANHPADITARQSLAMLHETVWHNPAEAVRLCQEVRHIAPDTPGIDACIQRNLALISGPAPP